MARSSGSCHLDVSSMIEEDKIKLLKAIEGLNPEWLVFEYLYEEGMKSLDLEEAGFDWSVHEDILWTYMRFIITFYPNVETSGEVGFEWIISEGSDIFYFDYSNGVFHVTECNLPLDYLQCCPECDADLYFDTSDLTEDNCKDIIKCPECGHEIDLSEWNMEVSTHEYTKDDIGEW